MSVHPILCPYCGHTFDAIPQQKRKCPGCKKVVCPKATPEDREKKLMTEAEAEEAEELWERYGQRQRALSILSTCGLEEAHLHRELAAGAKSDAEAVTALLFSVAVSAADLHDKKMAFYQLALAAEREGHPFREFLAHAARCELLRYQQSGVKKVEILSAGEGNACPQCQSHNGRILTVDDALQKMPVPCSSCTQTLQGDMPGFCRCSYIAAFD